jgi:hypothetical protein
MNFQLEINSNNASSGRSNSHSNNHPDVLKLVDTLEDNKHIVLFYEDLERARIVECRYIKNGLLKGQEGIHISPENIDISFIKNEMVNNGIDVESFTKKSLLHIRQISNTRNHKEGSVKGFENIAKEILNDLKSPLHFRTVVMHFPEVKTEEQIASRLVVECTYHSTFHSFSGSLLCSYPVKEMEPRRHGKWLVDILHNHHAAIFAPKSGQGIAFNME